MRLLSVVFCFLLLLATGAQADKRQDLKNVEATLKKERETQEKYAAQQSDIESKLRQLRGELLELTGEIQAHEKALLKVEDKRQATQNKIEESKKRLEKRRESLADLIVAIQRLNRLPPQALLARPSVPIDTARSYTLLQHVVPNVSAQAREVKDILDELASLQETQDRQVADLRDEQNKLNAKRASLGKIVARRQTLLRDTQRNHDRAAQKVAALSTQAKDLRDLLDRLNREDATFVPKRSVMGSVRSTFRAWMGGDAKLPVAGKVKMGYGQSMPGGGISKGISIQAASGALVTAPGGGVIRFAGPFRQYKLLVIIQHPNGEHSLLGGLQELYAEAGDRVEAGEPLGKLPGGKMEGDSTRSASLYYERRRNGKPVDPRFAKG